MKAVSFLKRAIIRLLGISQNERLRPSNAIVRTTHSHPICQRRPWLSIVSDHPGFPKTLPDHPAQSDYLRSWELFAGGLSLRPPGDFGEWAERWERGETRPRVRHWRLAGVSKMVLLLRKIILWRRR